MKQDCHTLSAALVPVGTAMKELNDAAIP